jgi:hypothetical protein
MEQRVNEIGREAYRYEQANECFRHHSLSQKRT